MKKITLLTLLLWSSLFYGQTYLSEGFEGGTFPPTGWQDIADPLDASNTIYAATSLAEDATYIINNPGTTDFTLIGAPDNNPGTEFTATGPGTGTGDAIGKAYFWTASTAKAHSGTKSAFFDDFNGENNKWLISSAMDLSGPSVNPVLTYWMSVQFPDFNATTTVHYSTDYNGSNFGTATWNQIDIISTGEANAAEDLWKVQGTFDLSAANGDDEVYIAFHYVGDGASRWYLDDILVREQLTCIEPSEGSISNILSTSADFSWTSGPGGTETLWDVELVDLTAGQTHNVNGTITSTSSNPYSFTSLTTGNSYAAYVRADCGGGDKSAWTGPFAFSTAGDNDDCSGAEEFTQEVEIATAVSATAHSGTISGATDSGLAAEMCNGSAGTANDDVWFAFEARTDAVNITFESMDFDGVAMLYSGTCGSLTLIDCADDTFSGSNDTEEIDASGLTAGTTYYVRVFSWDSGAIVDGSFTVKFWSSEALSNDDVEDLVEFKLYPNPVQDKLNLRAQDNIENVSVYNMLGQEVLRQAPNKNSSEVDMSTLQTGSYFVKVTINGVTETKQIIKR